MGTKLLSSSGGKEFDGTDYIYVYGDSDPLTNGQELQSALYQAGIDKVATGRKQTVMVGPGTYSPEQLGDYFYFDSIATSIRSITGDTDVILKSAGPSRALSFDSNSSGDLANYLTQDINAQIYAAEQEMIALYGSSEIASYTRCKSDYIDLLDGSMLLYNEGSGASGQRFIRITDTNYVIGPNLQNTFSNWNLDNYHILKNPITNALEIYAVGYWNAVNNRILFRINPVTLDVDGSFSYVILSGGVLDMVIVDNSDLVVVGDFNTANGLPTVKIAKISSIGAVYNFGTGAGFNNNVWAVTYVPSNNQLYVGGDFTTYQGNSCNFFTIIDNANGNFVASSGYPNNRVVSLKYFSGSGKLCAFGYFSGWGSTATSGRNAVITLNGGFSAVLYNEMVNQFYDKTQVTGTINEGGTEYLRFVASQSNVTTLDGIPVNYGDIIEWNLDAGTFTAYAVSSFASNYQGSNVFNVIWARHYTDALRFAVWGYIYYNQLRILQDTASGFDYDQYPYATLNGLEIQGAFVVSAFMNVNECVIKNCQISSLFDTFSYNNITQSPQVRIRLVNTRVNAIIHPSDLVMEDNSYVGAAYVPNATLANNGMAFATINMTDSTLSSAYNSKGIFIPFVRMERSKLYGSFNSGYRNVFAGQSNYLNINEFEASNSNIQGSFQYTKLPAFNIRSCKIDSSFTWQSLPSDINPDVVLNSNINLYGSVTECHGYASFYQNFNWARGRNLTDMYFGTVSVNFENCSFTGGSAISFIDFPCNIIRDSSFVNCNVSNPNSNASYALYITVMPDYNANNYELGSGDFGNIVFSNCTVTNYQFALVVGLVTSSNINQLYVRNIVMNNCVHNAFVYYYDVSVFQSTTFVLDTYTGFSVNDFVLDRGRITNCSVDSGKVTEAFFSNYTVNSTMTIIDYLFKNCHVSNRAESSYSFRPLSFFSEITASNLNIGSNPGVGLRFEDCSTSAPNAPYASNDWAPSYSTYGFLARLSIGSLLSYSQRPIVFINCSAMEGFIAGDNTSSYISGQAYVYAKDSVAYAQSFGKNVANLYGQFINCDGGYGSFGDAFDFGSGLAATYGSATFVGCQGQSPFGLYKALPTVLTINGAGYLYHFTTIGWSGGSPTGSGLINWNAQQYNV